MPEMATTKIIIATVPKSDQVKSFNMLPTSRKAEILQQMAAAADAKLGLQPSKAKVSLTDSNPPPRKRQRLTHLTPEEKMMRRKLKNRVAAQTARDRKKAQMDGLENTASLLEARNKQLQIENTLLRKENQSLADENAQLKRRLQGKTEETSVVVLDHGYCVDSTTSSSIHLSVKKEADAEPSEPAALSSPPQQELARRLLTLLSMMLTWSLTMSYLACSASSTKQPRVEPFASSRTPQGSWEQEQPLCLVTKKSKRASSGDQEWWGPQQQSWNPSKN
ncbi:uncharacterized protein [Diadema setosum]|uniref:uncharacterized protein n=1 Tax=Diadema setosum TaxID=31175 RepID=UPI003B3B5C8A